jgi:hypothetical protein
MSKLDDAIGVYMAQLVLEEHRPFSYRDFLHFEVDGIGYKMAHGTFRNKISKLIKAGVVEFSYNSCIGFYTLKGTKFGKPMTSNHMGASHNPIVKLIQNLPFDKNALHDIHLRFQVKGCWSILSASSTCRMHPISKDIYLPQLKVGDLKITASVHKTDTVTVVVGCSYSPIAVDIPGIIRLSTALTRVEERLSRLIEEHCGKNIVPSPSPLGQYQGKISAAVIPDYRSWLVTMWHFGTDSSIEYTGEKFSASWEISEHQLIRVYSKEFHCTAGKEGARTKHRTKIRVESQEYPQSTVEHTIKNILYHSNNGGSTTALKLENNGEEVLAVYPVIEDTPFPKANSEKMGIKGVRT